MARTDNDSWDLASSVGSTATMVAAQRVLSNREGLIDDPYAEPLVRAVGLDFFIRALDGEIDARRHRPSVQRAPRGGGNGSPHPPFRHAVHRRRRRGRPSGGDPGRRPGRAGLSVALARRAPPSTSWTSPRSSRSRGETLAELGAEPTADRRTVAIDLREDWPKALRDNGFDPTQPTAWIAEGLLIYLPPEAQDLLFDRIDELSAPGSRVATEHIPDISAFSDERSQEIADRLKQYGHDIEMSDLIYRDERNDVIDYLTARGWDVTAQTMRDAYAANGFEFPEDGAMGFFADMSYLSAIKR